MFWIHGLKEGDEVQVVSQSITLDGEFYYRNQIFKIVRECWPDEWMIFGPTGENHKITNSMLMDNFSRVGKPQPVPVPTVLTDWFEKTKGYIGG
jgi:hypothetical protein